MIPWVPSEEPEPTEDPQHHSRAAAKPHRNDTMQSEIIPPAFELKAHTRTRRLTAELCNMVEEHHAFPILPAQPSRQDQHSRTPIRTELLCTPQQVPKAPFTTQNSWQSVNRLRQQVDKWEEELSCLFQKGFISSRAFPVFKYCTVIIYLLL